MKKNLLFIFAVNIFAGANAQTCQDASVELSAIVQKTPPKITLNWVNNPGTSQYYIYKKLKTGTSWGTSIATLTGTINQYIDTNVVVGISYEYRVQRSGTTSGFGYINSGIEVPVTESRGNLLLMVDSTFITPLAAEITRLMDDLEGDGWKIIRHDVKRNATVTHIKSIIVADYLLNPVNTKAVFLIGHVPVPYSGNLNPDGHPDHQGAWPADVYYGDINGVWTDISVTSTTISPIRTQNVPGDGKFDQSVIPSDADLQVGRADFANLPSFAASEQSLLKNYLDKDHNYRKKIFTAIHQAVIDDNFGYFGGEAFASGGFKNFAPLVGPSNVVQADYFTNMTGTTYLWAYGCGGGTYTSATGIGNTANFASSNLQGVFSMLFGSYFGDWDSNDNFLRAPLAQGTILTNVWSGRPHWVFHHMSMGENMGYDVRLSQNNNFLYDYNYGGRFVHVALMGDPTLRNDIVAPVSNVVATKTGNNCLITWTSSPEPGVLGYNIYMKNDTNTNYIKINGALIAGTTYTDNCLVYKGIYKYMVRALVLQTSPSGTYFNMSEGIADTALNNTNIKVYASFSVSVGGNTATFTNGSTNATNYSWAFGDGNTSTAANPVHIYLSGTYNATLIATNGCDADTFYLPINITVGIKEINSLSNHVNVYPNPSSGKLFVSLGSENANYIEIIIYNAEGKKIYYGDELTAENEIDLSYCTRGLYLLQIKNKNNESCLKKFTIE